MKRLAMRCMLACGLAAAGAGWAAPVQTKERWLTIRYKDGVVERYKVAWNAQVAMNVRDSGATFVPYQGAVENRRCSWTLTASIERTVAMATRLGPTLPLPTMNRSIKTDFESPGKDSSATTTVSESCRDATASRERGLRDATQALLGAFERLTEADLDSLRQEAQSRSEVAQFLAE